MESLKSKIEQWVTERNTLAAKQAIHQYLESETAGSDDKLLEACDWYRRLGLHADALRILRLSEGIRGWGSEKFRRRRIYWLARSLNLLGASEFARSLVSQLNPVSSDEYRLLGGIALTRFEYAEAVSFYKQMTKTDPDPSSYSSRVASVSYADALYSVGEHEEALRIVQDVTQRSSEPMAQGIARSAEGEYLARRRLFSEALPVLQTALSLLPSSDRSSDMGFL